jgi:predicted dehydrogenase
MAQEPLRLALLGCGVISRHHIDAIATLGGGRILVTAIIEPNADRRTAAVASCATKLSYEPRAFESLAAAAAADPERALFTAVDIMVPSYGKLHEDCGVEALRLGYHVHVEKPLSNCLASCARLIAAAPAGAVLMCAENSQYWREVVEARRLIRSGAIGQVLTARAKYWESADPRLNEWAADGSYLPGAYVCEAAEGFVFDGGLHWLRPLRMLLGECTHAVATAGRTIGAMTGPGLLNALLKFEGGASAVFESVLAPAAISEQPFFVVQGTKGEIVLDGFGGGGRVYTMGEGGLTCADINAGWDGPVGWETGYAGELEDFAAACVDGRPPQATALDAMADLRLMLAIMSSAKSGRWEAVAEVAPELSMDTLGLTLEAGVAAAAGGE